MLKKMQSPVPMYFEVLQWESFDKRANTKKCVLSYCDCCVGACTWTIILERRRPATYITAICVLLLCIHTVLVKSGAAHGQHSPLPQPLGGVKLFGSTTLFHFVCSFMGVICFHGIKNILPWKYIYFHGKGPCKYIFLPYFY